MSKKSKYFYDLNVQVWEDSGQFFYSVIQEFDEEGKDVEVIAYGFDPHKDTVLDSIRNAVDYVLGAE